MSSLWRKTPRRTATPSGASRTEGPQRPGQRTSRGGLKAAKAIVPEIRRDGGGAEPATYDASIRTNPEARARIQAFVERRGALRRLAPQLLRVVPLGDDSVEFGPVDLGHDPWIHLLLAEVGRRHHAERREQAALDGSVVLEQRLIGNGSLVALDRLEDGAADEVVWRLSDRPSVTFRPACPVPRRGHECTSVEP